MRIFSTQTGLHWAIIILKVHRRCGAILRTSESTISVVLDTVFGFQLGGIAGWFVGWILGSVYRHLFEPAEIIGFDEVRYWYELPQTFAYYGILTGALAGMIFFHICLQINGRKRGEL